MSLGVELLEDSWASSGELVFLCAEFQEGGLGSFT